MMTLQRYRDFRPTSYDAPGLNSADMGHDPDVDDGDRSMWYVAPCGVNRDSGALDRANWKAQQAILTDAGVTYEIHRFRHWGPGWFEVALIRPTPEAEAVLIRLTEELADYPVLDDAALSDEERADDDADWANWLRREVTRAIEREARPDETDDADMVLGAVLPAMVGGRMAYDVRDLYDAAADRECGGDRYCDQSSSGRSGVIALVVRSVWARYRSRPADPRAFLRWRGRGREQV